MRMLANEIKPTDNFFYNSLIFMEGRFLGKWVI